jgi:hypothetical protein
MGGGHDHDEVSPLQRASSDVPSGWYSKFQRARAYSFDLTLLAVPTPPLTQARPKQASQAEMIAAKVDVAYRDQCAALLIPLNQCVFSLFPRNQPSCPSCAGSPSSNRSPPSALSLRTRCISRQVPVRDYVHTLELRP